MGCEIKQSTSVKNLTFPMYLTGTNTLATGKTVTVQLMKNGADFVVASGAVTEGQLPSSGGASGVYSLAGNTTDSNTLGLMILKATASGCDPTIQEYNVTKMDDQDANAGGLARLDASISSRMATFSVPTNFSALAITSGGSVTVGTNSDKTGYSLSSTQTFNNTGTWTGNIVGTLSTLTTYTGNTPQTGDAFSRLGAPAGASHAADVAAVKTDTAAVKTQTDKLTYNGSNQVYADIRALWGAQTILSTDRAPGLG